jgi:hypothetical protein
MAEQGRNRCHLFSEQDGKLMVVAAKHDFIFHMCQLNFPSFCVSPVLLYSGYFFVANSVFVLQKEYPGKTMNELEEKSDHLEMVLVTLRTCFSSFWGDEKEVLLGRCARLLLYGVLNKGGTVHMHAESR